MKDNRCPKFPYSDIDITPSGNVEKKASRRYENTNSSDSRKVQQQSSFVNVKQRYPNTNSIPCQKKYYEQILIQKELNQSIEQQNKVMNRFSQPQRPNSSLNTKQNLITNKSLKFVSGKVSPIRSQATDLNPQYFEQEQYLQSQILHKDQKTKKPINSGLQYENKRYKNGESKCSSQQEFHHINIQYTQNVGSPVYQVSNFAGQEIHTIAGSQENSVLPTFRNRQQCGRSSDIQTQSNIGKGINQLYLNRQKSMNHNNNLSMSHITSTNNQIDDHNVDCKSQLDRKKYLASQPDKHNQNSRLSSTSSKQNGLSYGLKKNMSQPKNMKSSQYLTNSNQIKIDKQKLLLQTQSSNQLMNSTMSEKSHGSQSQMSSKLYHSAFLSNQMTQKDAKKDQRRQSTASAARLAQQNESLQRRKSSNYSQMFISQQLNNQVSIPQKNQKWTGSGMLNGQVSLKSFLNNKITARDDQDLNDRDDQQAEDLQMVDNNKIVVQSQKRKKKNQNRSGSRNSASGLGVKPSSSKMNHTKSPKRDNVKEMTAENVKTEVFQIETKNLIIESIEDQNQKLMAEIDKIKQINEDQMQEYERTVSDLIKDKQDLQDVNANQLQQIDAFELQNEQLKSKLELQFNLKPQSTNQDNSQNPLQHHISSLQEKIDSLLSQLDSHEQHHLSHSQEQLETIKSKDDLLQNQHESISNLMIQNSTQIQTITELQNVNEQLRSENDVLHQSKQSFAEVDKVIIDLQSVISRLREELKEAKQERNSLRNDKMSNTKGLSKYEEVVQLKDDKIDLFQRQIQSLKEVNLSNDKQIQQQTQILQQQQNELVKLREGQSIINILKKENQTLKESMMQYEKHIEGKEKQIKVQKEEANDKENKISLLTERINQVQDRDVELERIFDYAYDLTKINFVYKEVDGDKVDKKLADIINTSDKNTETSMNKAKLLFVRESEGVYTYCKKKVFMKVMEEDRLIIRVGGGYMSLEEFIDTFNPFQQWKPKNLRSYGGMQTEMNTILHQDEKNNLYKSASKHKISHNRSSPALERNHSQTHCHQKKPGMNKSSCNGGDKIKGINSMSKSTLRQDLSPSPNTKEHQEMIAPQSFTNITNMINIQNASPAQRRNKNARTSSNGQGRQEKLRNQLKKQMNNENQMTSDVIDINVPNGLGDNVENYIEGYQVEDLMEKQPISQVPQPIAQSPANYEYQETNQNDTNNYQAEEAKSFLESLNN